ncbi:hypothetical protein [Embleya sp. MST-111070]|uniref:hypothetical protein n=1 Tax=Embleya sp. MST-111070 TaxID=3398231 RepID=UPI003F73516A
MADDAVAQYVDLLASGAWDFRRFLEAIESGIRDDTAPDEAGTGLREALPTRVRARG